jgi:hypothetical protein
MALIDRIKGICLKPNAEWPVIEAETTSTRELMLGYVAPLAAIGPAASFVGGVFIGRTLPILGTSYHVPLVAGLTLAVTTYVLSLVGIFVLSLIINALAPSFGGQKNSAQALKVAVYSYTPAWVAGVLTILTSLSLLAALAGIYGLYLLYLGLPVLMKSPKEKSVGYTVVVVICAIVLSVVIGAVAVAVGGTGMLAAGGFRGIPHAGGVSSTGPVQFDKDSPLGRLQAMGEAMKESNAKMEAAQKSGDPNAQAQAAMQGLGTLFGGGKRVEPLGIDQLKPFVPPTFAGLEKTGGSAEKNGMAGLAVSKAEGLYSDHAKRHVTLEITDTGGASGLVGMAGWMNLQGEREDDNGFEKTEKVDGRLMHEKGSKRPGGSNEFTVVLGDRFIVSASGSVELPELKAGVSGLDLGKLEAMKLVGVAK